MGTHIAFTRMGTFRIQWYQRIDTNYQLSASFNRQVEAGRAVQAAKLGGHDVVILDRYVASNAAYSAARLHQDAEGDQEDADRPALQRTAVKSWEPCKVLFHSIFMLQI